MKYGDIMNAAKLEKSERLQRVKNLLDCGGRYSTRQISEQAQVCAVSSVIAELRFRGYPVKKAVREKDVWYYEADR